MQLLFSPMKTPLSTASSPLVALKDFDWRRLQRLADPQTMKDLDQFLDNLPLRAGKNALIIAAAMWFLAACALFLLFHNTLTLKDIQKQMSLAEGTQITVPQIAYGAVDLNLLKPIVEKLKKIYPSLTFDIQSDSTVTIKGTTTRDFPAWRAAIGDLAYGAPGWKLSVKKFCTGNGCLQAPLLAVISVQNVDIRMPVVTPTAAEDTNSETTTDKPTKP